jgi:hypothetical protein
MGVTARRERNLDINFQVLFGYSKEDNMRKRLSWEKLDSKS